MERKTYLSHYRVALDESGSPVEIQRSGSAVVYKGNDRASGEQIALEVFSAANLSQPLRQRLEAEAKIAKRLDHINIPIVHDFGFDGDEMVYATEYFEGTTAEDWVKSHGPLATGTMLRMALQAVSALGAAAFHGIFHYAINPQNIMLVPGQTQQGDWPLIKVLHFVGLAPALASSTLAGAAPVKFASPEQLEDGKVDFRSEMYSLGCVLWFLVTGEAPQAGAATVETASGMSGPVKRLLSQMLAADPNNRPLDPLALQKQINDCISHLDRLQSVASKFGLAAPSSTTPIQASAPPPPPAQKRAPMKGLALAALLLGLGLLGALILPDWIRSREELASTDQDSIGVPIGVPEVSGARANASGATTPGTRQMPATAALTTAPPAALANTENTDAPPSTTSVAPLPSAVPVGEDLASVLAAATPVPSPVDQVTDAPAANDEAGPPVVTSVVERSPAEEGEASPEVVAADSAAQSLQAADNAAANDVRSDEPSLPLPSADSPQETAPVVTADSEVPAEKPEPEPPFEGPTEVAASTPPDVPSPAGTAAEETAAETDETPTANTVVQSSSSADGRDAIGGTTSKANAPKVSTSNARATRAAARKVAAKKTSRSAKKTHVASKENRPPLPRGAIRAAFLGTTQDGNLIFGLPSSERGYVAAPSSSREGASRRRARRTPVEPEQLPVLPALPPDG